MIRNSHDKLSVFGLGKDMKADEWRGLYRQLLAAGYLAGDDDGHGTLQLTDRSRPLLRGDEQFKMRKLIMIAGRGSSSSREKKASRATRVASGSETLFEALRALPARVFHHALTIPKPIIAAVNGACAGMGFSHAMVCDLRFAAAGAKFTTAFVRRGLIAEWALAWTLQRVAGPARALDVLMSGRVVLAEEAKELGIVNEVVAPEALMDRVVAYATDLITNCSPSSMAAIKRQVWQAGEQTIDESLSWAIELMQASLKQADFKEGVKSFVEKRPPSFPPVKKGWATDIEP